MLQTEFTSRIKNHLTQYIDRFRKLASRYLTKKPTPRMRHLKNDSRCRKE